MELVSALRFIVALVFVIGLIAGLAWMLRRYGNGRVALGGAKGRLSIVEATHVDAKRRLVLVRRDGVEHLILLSPNTETVVETGIPAGGDFARELTAQSGSSKDGAKDGPRDGGDAT